MKRLLILGTPTSAQDESPEILLDFMARALESDEVSIRHCPVDRVAFIVGNDSMHILDSVNGGDIAENDLVWFRGKIAAVANDVATIANYLRTKGVDSINTFYSNRRAVGKVAQMYLLATHDLSIPKTVCALHDMLPKLVADELSYPVVLKDCYASHGDNNFLIGNSQELQRRLDELPDVRFMVQQYIEGRGDYRILFAGNDQRIIHRLGNDGSHLNNTSQGAQANLVPTHEISNAALADARKFAALAEYEIAGVDLILDVTTGQHYFLEINSQPQVYSGAYVPEKERLIGGYLRRRLGL